MNIFMSQRIPPGLPGHPMLTSNHYSVSITCGVPLIIIAQDIMATNVLMTPAICGSTACCCCLAVNVRASALSYTGAVACWRAKVTQLRANRARARADLEPAVLIAKLAHPPRLLLRGRQL